MSDRTSRISTIDRFISYISPSAGIKRIQAKAAIDAYAYGSSSGYTGRKTRYGLSNTMPVEDDTDYSLSQLRNYSRSLVTYTTIGAWAVYINASNTIGTRLKMQPSILEDVVPLSKEQIEALQVQIKQRWKLWAESLDCDFHGQFTFYQLQFLMYISKLTSGDVLVTLPLAHEDRTVNGLQGRISCPGFFDDIAGKRAYCHASSVGIALGQINPAVEVKAAVDRINGKISSRKKESATLGY